MYPDIASARNPFTEMFRLEEITLSEENNNFYFDGVSLYSTNNNVLYAVFPNGETHYEVPENIEVISEYAFRFYSFKGAEQHISLDLPSNLQYLNSWCFGDIVLSEIELPESLRHIGSGAFYTSTFESLYIPKNVNSLGSDIVLSNEKLKEFVVHPENEYYTSVDGVIYSKDLGMLIEAPSNLQTSEYVILEGTTYVSQRALSTLMNVKRIVIPTSITILQWCSIGGYVLEEIEYLGTIEQWSNIEKGSNGYDYWYERYNVDNVIGVTCSDGLVELRFEY